MTPKRTTKESVELAFRRAPIVGESVDPVIAGILWLVLMLGIVGVALAGSVLFPHDKDARSHVIQLAGGVLLVLGAYFTVRNLMASQAQQYAERLRTTIAELDKSSPAVQRAAVNLLEAMAYENSGLPGNSEGKKVDGIRKNAIYVALKAFADTPDRDETARKFAAAASMNVGVRLGLGPDSEASQENRQTN